MITSSAILALCWMRVGINQEKVVLCIADVTVVTFIVDVKGEMCRESR